MTTLLPDQNLRPWHRLERQTSGELLRAGLFGLERESLRVTPDGRLALTPHPAAFGEKLGNPRITVDFSESQLEMITSPAPSVEQALDALAEIRREAEGVLAEAGERLWPFSMPPPLPAERDIPIARFGDTPEGRRGELYRLGLGNRYGRRRQVISGIHFSFSFHPALLAALGRAGRGTRTGASTEEAYFRTARNFLRHRWLLIYLTGASPAADATFHPELGRHLETVRACCRGRCDFLTDYRRFATSLRVSRFGYADAGFRHMPVSFNSRAEYVRDLRALLATPSARFARLGRPRNGQPVQLNDRVLQRDSEFYAAIRLKGRTHPGESHLDAIDREGVHYAEVRILDINPFAPERVDAAALRFLQVLLLNALLAEDEPLRAAEWERMQENHQRVALCGRRPGLRLRTAAGEAPMRLVAAAIFTRLRALAVLMDRGLDRPRFGAAIDEAWQSLLDPSRLPSARIQRTMEREELNHAAYGARLLQEAGNPAALARASLVA
jgi:glutamate--cysteine ligase